MKFTREQLGKMTEKVFTKSCKHKMEDIHLGVKI